MTLPRLIFRTAGIAALALLAVVAVTLTRWLAAPRFRGPHLVVEPGTVDFGVLQPNAVVTQEVILRNAGSETLSVENIVATCGCAATEIKTKYLDPGQRTTLTVTLDARGYAQRIQKALVIESNDADSPTFLLMLRAYIRVGLRADRSRVFLGSGQFGDHLHAEVPLLRDPGEVPPAVTISGDVKGLVLTELGWVKQREIEVNRVVFRAAPLSEPPGWYVRKLQVHLGKDKACPLDVAYEVRPSVCAEPAVVRFQSEPRPVGATHLRLRWSLGSPTFTDCTSLYQGCDASVAAIGNNEAVLSVRPKSNRVSKDADFDVVVLSYLIRDTTRESTVIPVLFMPLRDSRRATPSTGPDLSDAVRRIQHPRPLPLSTE